MSHLPFHPLVARWFADALGTPTPAQVRGWRELQAGRHTLIAAPTGSGKTLAAFLAGIDALFREAQQAQLPDEVRILYVSPLKALSADIQKNLTAPCEGISRLAEAEGLRAPQIRCALRTGDTTASERARLVRTPPHVLVTTPESLYLLLTAEHSREILRTVQTVIVDEIHAVIGTRRGAHLALSLERLQRVARQPIVRIGLSATQRPIDLVARYLVGPAADCAIVDEGHARPLDLDLELPRSTLDAVLSNDIWREYYDRLAELIGTHRTTLVFVNTRRLAERLARHLSERLGDAAVTAHHGSLSKERRLDAEQRLKSGQLRALVATASLELGIDIGHVDLVCQIGSPHRIATLLQRVGRSGHSVSGTPKGRIFPTSRDDLIETLALVHAVRRGELDRIVTHDAPLDVLAQQVVAEAACDDYADDELFGLVGRAWPYRELTREQFDAVLAMTADGYATRRGRRGALLHRDEVHGRVRGRRGARLLALTSGGAIPEIADYRVVLEGDDTFIGTLNEDFAIESNAGDIFQLGNASWRVVQVLTGTIRVADAGGAPPTIPFWLGEAPARSDELSMAVSRFRGEVEQRLAETSDEAVRWVREVTGAALPVAGQAVDYLSATILALGVIPTQDTLVLERFFDEAGGMQLILHAPFGSRINKAWGLALRKRFCRQFNFELQAAATEDALLLSLGPQHSFPLADVFRYLHSATAKDVLTQALLDAPVFKTRWRWNTTISLAVPRSRGGHRVAPQIQRMQAEDLMAAVFPDAAACLENIPGDRQVPDHPLVAQAVRDCLEEAMDFTGLAAVLDRIHAGAVRLVARDTPEPSPIAHEILNARPYAFLDDAPLEERRTQAVYTRRASDPGAAADTGHLDLEAIRRVQDEARPDPRDAAELHDALLTAGFLTAPEMASFPPAWRETLTATRRVARSGACWVAAERLREWQAVHPDQALTPPIEAPAGRRHVTWSRGDAIVELLRGRIALAGPVTLSALAADLAVAPADAETAMLALEAQGVVLRGRFSGAVDLEFCERGLLARIHRYTLNRLRAEIEPVTAGDFQRFLFSWHGIDAGSRLSGPDGLLAAIVRLEGYELPARSWERTVLPARLDRYDPAWLDMACLAGQVRWARLSPATADSRRGRLRVALALGDSADAWLTLRPEADVASAGDEAPMDGVARAVLAALRGRGPTFFRQLVAAAAVSAEQVMAALVTLAAMGLVTSDGFAGVRAVVNAQAGRSARPDRQRDLAGRWSAPAAPAVGGREQAVERQAQALLQRYGVVCRALLQRETNAVSWRDLGRVYRRLEARGEIRGGRFVSGLSGEQFALPEAVELLRETRRRPSPGPTVISAVDPLNLTGVLTSGERVRAVTGTRIAYQRGLPVAVLEGEYLRPLAALDDDEAVTVSAALSGRRLNLRAPGFVGRAS